MAATSTACPDGKLGPLVGTSAPRRIACGWLVPGRWRAGRWVVIRAADQALRHQLQARGEDHADRDRKLSCRQRDREAGDRADRQVAELHDRPEGDEQPAAAGR